MTRRWRKKKKLKFRCRSTENCAAWWWCRRAVQRTLSCDSALSDEKIKAMIAGKQIVKKIVVPGKLVNLVVR